MQNDKRLPRVANFLSMQGYSFHNCANVCVGLYNRIRGEFVPRLTHQQGQNRPTHFWTVDQHAVGTGAQALNVQPKLILTS